MLRITESRGSRSTTLYISGKINDTTSTQLQNEIFRAAKLTKSIDLDFSDVETINGAGCQVILSGIRLTASRKGTITVHNPNSKVKIEMQKEGLGKVLVN